MALVGAVQPLTLGRNQAMKKPWVVGITTDCKVLMREYQDEQSKKGLIVSHIFVTSNPNRSGEIKAWCDAMKGILREKEA